MEEHVLQIHQNDRENKRKRPIESEFDSDAEDVIEDVERKLWNKPRDQNASLQSSDADRALYNSSSLMQLTARYDSEIEDAARDKNRADGIADNDKDMVSSSLGRKSSVDALVRSFQAPPAFSCVHDTNTPSLAPISGATNHSEGSLNSDDNERSESNSDDARSYSVALRHFGLWTDESNEQDLAPHNGNGTNSSSAGFLSTTSTISNGTAAISDKSLLNGSTESQDDLQVAVENRTRVADKQRTLDLLCWHAANGIDCRGKTGKSPRTRHLYK